MWNGSPLNSLMIGLPLLFMTPGMSTFAVLFSRFASRSIGKYSVSHNSEQVDAKTEKRLLSGAQASPEMIDSISSYYGDWL